MPDAVTTIEGRTVIADGSIVCKMNQEVLISPFENDLDYAIKFHIKLAPPGQDHKSRIYQAPGNKVVIEHEHQWEILLNDVVVNNTAFANDSDKIYRINYYLRFVGQRDNYSTIIVYTIFAENQ